MAQYSHRFAFGTTLEVTRRDARDSEDREVWQVALTNSLCFHASDVRSGVGYSLTAEEATIVVLDFLAAFLEASEGSENYEIYPSWVRSSIDSDEVEILLLELQDEY